MISNRPPQVTTWRKEIAAAKRRARDGGKLIACTLAEAKLDVEFDQEYGGIKGKPFTAWTEGRVYFPICYDGSEWCSSAPRHPCDQATKHQGG